MAGVVANCQHCGIEIYDEQTRRMLCSACEILGVTPVMKEPKRRSPKKQKAPPPDGKSFLRNFKNIDLSGESESET